MRKKEYIEKHGRKAWQAFLEKQNKQNRKYYIKNKDKISEKSKEYYKEHKIEILKYSKIYQKEHSDKTIAKTMRHNGKGFAPLTESVNGDFEWHHVDANKPYVIAVPKEIHRSNLKIPEHYSDINGKWLIWAATHPKAKLKK